MTALPLAGLTVVSIEQAVAAPFATRQLADLGARVIKIERDSGDFARNYDTTAVSYTHLDVYKRQLFETVALSCLQTITSINCLVSVENFFSGIKTIKLRNFSCLSLLMNILILGIIMSFTMPVAVSNNSSTLICKSSPLGNDSIAVTNSLQL